MHPLLENIKDLKDAEIEAKIQDLSKKFWMTHNSSVQMQMQIILEQYQAELAERRAKMWEQQYQKREKGLDNLIKVS